MDDFLDLLVPGAGMKRWAFQTFDDKGEDRTLARVMFGTPHDVLPKLAPLNDRGAGVFFAPNEFAPGVTKRKNENVVGFRLYWLDLDGAPLEPVMDSQTPPLVVVETSPERYHCYWRVDQDVDADVWRSVQAGLAARFGGDASMTKPAGVMRLPGFLHQKGDPFEVRVVASRKGANPHSMVEFYGDETIVPHRADAILGPIAGGSRNTKLASLAGTVRRRGCEFEEIFALIRATNRLRCKPPLDEGEVRNIAKSVSGYRPEDAWRFEGDIADAAADAWDQV